MPIAFVPVARCMPAALALAGALLCVAWGPAAAQSGGVASRPSMPAPTDTASAFEQAMRHMAAGDAQRAQGDPARLRYPFAPGYRRVLDAAEREARNSRGGSQPTPLLEGVRRLQVVTARQDESRAFDARAAARVDYLRAVVILERLAAAEPGNGRWQNALAMAQASVGDVSGEWKGALVPYDKALALQQPLVQREPGHRAWQHDLARIHQAIGRLQFGIGGEPMAQASKIAELGLREKLAEAEPANLAWQNELALNYDRLGEMFHALANRSQARDAFKAGWEIHDRLVRNDPGNVQWLRDLARNRSAAGEFELYKGDETTGVAALEEALQLRTQLIERAPRDTEAQRDLLQSYILLARYHGNAERHAEAIAIYQAALAHLQRLAARDPANPAWLYYQAEIQFLIGFEQERPLRPLLGDLAPGRPPKDPQLIADTGATSKKNFNALLDIARQLVALNDADASGARRPPTP